MNRLLKLHTLNKELRFLITSPAKFGPKGPHGLAAVMKSFAKRRYVGKVAVTL